MGWTVDHVPDQIDRVAVVTGANRGIGFETTKALADHGATVVMACRNDQRAAEARERIRESIQGADLRTESLDLASLRSIADCAERIADAGLDVDLLVNNAGIMGIPRRETADGFEYQFGVNHLGHFAFTGHVLDRLSPGGRIVTVSSEFHRQGEIDVDDLQSGESYGRWSAYAQSKLANLLFAYELDRRLEAADRDVISLAAHPGYAATGLQERAARGSAIRRIAMRAMNTLFAQSSAAGARPVLYAATAPDVPRRGYIGSGGLLNMRGHPVEQESSPASYDLEIARRLWAVSEEVTGVSYDLPEPGGPEGDPMIEAEVHHRG